MSIRIAASAVFAACFIATPLIEAATQPAAKAATAQKAIKILDRAVLLDQAHQRIVFGRRNASCFPVDESGIFQCLFDSGGRRAGRSVDQIDKGFDLRRFVFPERRPHPLYARDNGGDENNHLFVRELDGKRTDARRQVKSAVRWLESGRQRLLRDDQRARSEVFDGYRYDAKSYERKMLAQNRRV